MADKTLADLRDEVIKRLDKKYDLIYVDYRDELTADQVELLAEGDMEAFWDSLGEFESDQRWESVKGEIQYILEGIVREDEEWEELAADFYATDEWYEVREIIEERDEGDVGKKLARQTPAALMRVNVDYQLVNPEASPHPEDNGWPAGEHAPAAEDALRQVGLPVTEHNIEVMNSIFNEFDPYWGGAVGQWIFAMDVETLYSLPNDPDTLIEITDPYLKVGNPWEGNGWVNEEPFEGTVRVKRGDLHTDKGAWGYSWSETVGGVIVSGYECEVKVVEKVEA